MQDKCTQVFSQLTNLNRSSVLRSDARTLCSASLAIHSLKQTTIFNQFYQDRALLFPSAKSSEQRLARILNSLTRSIRSMSEMTLYEQWRQCLTRSDRHERPEKMLYQPLMEVQGHLKVLRTIRTTLKQVENLPHKHAKPVKTLWSVCLGAMEHKRVCNTPQLTLHSDTCSQRNTAAFQLTVRGWALPF